jgi:putative tricarboxylic transport membrane protein
MKPTPWCREEGFVLWPMPRWPGAVEGVAGPETANNAATAGGFVPLLTLGIPTNSVLALLLAALMLHGVTPGPLLLLKWPHVFWGVIASMYIGNIMLLILNLPLIGIFVQLLRIPYAILSPLIIMFVLLGAYALKRHRYLYDLMLWGFGLSPAAVRF